MKNMNLVEVKEDSSRDYEMHFSGAFLWDTKNEQIVLLNGYDGNCINYQKADGDTVSFRISPSKLAERFYGICLEDGLYNLRDEAVLVTRIYDGRFKKCSAVNNTIISPLGGGERDRLTLEDMIAIAESEHTNVLGKRKSVAVSKEFALVQDKEYDVIYYYDMVCGAVNRGGVTALIVPELYELAKENGFYA